MHDHEDTEQILLMSGSFRFGDVTMAPGDFLKVSKGVEHDGLAIEDSMLFVSHIGGLIIKK